MSFQFFKSSLLLTRLNSFSGGTIRSPTQLNLFFGGTIQSPMYVKINNNFQIYSKLATTSGQLTSESTKCPNSWMDEWIIASTNPEAQAVRQNFMYIYSYNNHLGTKQDQGKLEWRSMPYSKVAEESQNSIPTPFSQDNSIFISIQKFISIQVSFLSKPHHIHSISFPSNFSILQLKYLILSNLPSSFTNPSDIRLVRNGKPLSDARYCMDYELVESCRIIVVGALRGGSTGGGVATNTRSRTRGTHHHRHSCQEEMSLTPHLKLSEGEML